MPCRKRSLLVVCLATPVLVSFQLAAQTDPGPRPGSAAAGSFYPTLSPNEQAFFTQAQQRFQEIDSVSGKIAGEPGSGLGPTFNGNSCAQCHAQPAVGGSSPGTSSPQSPIPNPQVALATLDGATNQVPSFITSTGPVREARFIKTSTGTADGGVHGLYTITGRSDAVGCTLAQPDFADALTANNVIFRIPTPIFGLGLVEATPDSVLQANSDRDCFGACCAQDWRSLQHQRERWNHHALWLEGPEQIHPDVCGRGLQRGTRRLERTVPQRAQRG